MNKNGSSYVWVCVTLLVLCMLFTVVLGYFKAVTTVEKLREEVQLTLDSFVTDNATEIFDSVKNGKTNILNGDFNSSFNSLLSERLSLDLRSGMLYCTVNGNELLFKTSTPLTASIDGRTLSLKSSFTVYIPVIFCGVKLSDIPVRTEPVSIYKIK